MLSDKKCVIKRLEFLIQDYKKHLLYYCEHNHKIKKAHFLKVFNEELPPLLEELYEHVKNLDTINVNTFVLLIKIGLDRGVQADLDFRIVLCSKFIETIIGKLGRFRKSETSLIYNLWLYLNYSKNHTNLIKMNLTETSELQVSFHCNDPSRKSSQTLLEFDKMKEIFIRIANKMSTSALYTYLYIKTSKEHLLIQAIRCEDIDVFKYLVQRAKADSKNNYKNTIWKASAVNNVTPIDAWIDQIKHSKRPIVMKKMFDFLFFDTGNVLDFVASRDEQKNDLVYSPEKNIIEKLLSNFIYSYDLVIYALLRVFAKIEDLLMEKKGENLRFLYLERRYAGIRFFTEFASTNWLGKLPESGYTSDISRIILKNLFNFPLTFAQFVFPLSFKEIEQICDRYMLYTNDLVIDSLKAITMHKNEEFLKDLIFECKSKFLPSEFDKIMLGARDEAGNTFLHFIAKQRGISLLEYYFKFVEKNTFWTIQNKIGYTPFHTLLFSTSVWGNANEMSVQEYVLKTIESIVCIEGGDFVAEFFFGNTTIPICYYNSALVQIVFTKLSASESNKSGFFTKKHLLNISTIVGTNNFASSAIFSILAKILTEKEKIELLLEHSLFAENLWRMHIGTTTPSFAISTLTNINIIHIRKEHLQKMFGKLNDFPSINTKLKTLPVLNKLRTKYLWKQVKIYIICRSSVFYLYETTFSKKFSPKSDEFFKSLHDLKEILY